LADRVQRAGDRDVGDVVPGRLGERPVLAPAGHPPVDQPRVPRLAVGGADAEPFGDPGPVPLEQRVRALGEPQHHLGAPRVLEVHDDALLAAVGDVGHRRRGRGTGPVHPDHLGAEVGEQHRAERARPYPREFYDADPGQRAAAGPDRRYFREMIGHERTVRPDQCPMATSMILTMTMIIAIAR
jgi:hypothetical protein